jgi:lysophospholipase L1-like esterase
MAVPLTTITGKLLTPDGQPVTKGTVSARLSQPGSALDGAVSQRVAETATATVGADGSVSLSLVPNDAITPSGTHYVVTIDAKIGARGRQWVEKWQITGTAPLDIGEVPRLGVVPGIAVTTAAAVSESVVAAAESAQAAASASATAAQSAKVAAETARDAANATGKVYPDTTAGLAAVAEGAYFTVPSFTETESLILYRKVSGAAQEVKRYPSTKVFEEIADRTLAALSGYAYAVVDSSRRLAFGVKNDGSVFMTPDADTAAALRAAVVEAIKASGVLELGLNLTEVVATDRANSNIGGYCYALVDQAKRIAFGVRADGSLYVPHAHSEYPTTGEAESIARDAMGPMIVEGASSFIFTEQDGGGFWQVFSQSKTTGDVVALSEPGTNNYGIALSPDRTQVVFLSESDGVVTPKYVPEGGGTIERALSEKTIACWGDSLTNSIYPATLATIIGRDVVSINQSGGNSTQILARILAQPEYRHRTAVYWMGRNDSWWNSQGIATVKANIAAAVDFLKARNKRYLVLSILNGNFAQDPTTEWSEGLGTAAYESMMSLNADLAALYPGHFLDIRSYLVSQYNQALPQDILDYQHDTVPTSLRVDNIHLTAAGYTLVAQQVANFITSKGW